MKKFFIVLPLFILAFQTDLFSQTVYITKSGKKYHQEDCRYLKNSSIQIDINEAVERNYTPCSVCNLSSGNFYIEKKYRADHDNNYQKVRCMAVTKKNTQCKRNTSNPSGYCWQHER